MAFEANRDDGDADSVNQEIIDAGGGGGGGGGGIGLRSQDQRPPSRLILKRRPSAISGSALSLGAASTRQLIPGKTPSPPTKTLVCLTLLNVLILALALLLVVFLSIKEHSKGALLAGAGGGGGGGRAGLFSATTGGSMNGEELASLFLEISARLNDSSMGRENGIK